ncbi:MAG: hypothetical protein QG656_2335, partial [Candidatus Hydrogenedentes bacterium]|nr:hypothetical protein [Candidatus Hydrogenedentota bacterium]
MRVTRFVGIGMVAAFALVLTGWVPLAAAQGATTELKIELPKPMFIGTPKNIQTPNLEKAGTKRDPIMVPEGVKNLALEKTITASDDEPIIGDLEQITDGDKEGADGSFVEFGPDPQWVQIDLGAVSDIYAVALWHYHSQARVYKDVVVQVADDADFITNVRTVFNNDHDGSAGLGVGQDKEYIETNLGRPID